MLPTEAYYSEEWFLAEQRCVLDPAWQRVDSEATPAGAVTAEWEGMTFAAKAPATSLASALGALPDHIGSFRPTELVEIGRLDLHGRFNWKLFIENHLDVLHLWYLHHQTLGDFDHTAFEHQSLGANWASWEPSKSSAKPMTATPIRHLDERDRTGLGAHLLFPNTPFAAAASFFASYRALPVSPDETVIELRVLGEPDADSTEIIADIRAFIEEDIEACERIQHAVRSQYFEIGPLAVEHEAPLVRFQTELLDRMSVRV